MQFACKQWTELMKMESQKDYFIQLQQFVEKEYNEETIFPAKENIYKALQETPYHNVKVVILGQDPYHGLGQAHGLSFSVQHGVTVPPSLKNIYKELNSDIGIEPPSHGNLMKWAAQGVLLLNTVLTVKQGKANAHKGKGWEQFTDAIIRALNDREKPVVFWLWGNNAIAKEKLITNKHHYIHKSVHPSPLSARKGFFGSKPFSTTNEFLTKIGQKPIDWSL
ncbi:MULTISPECIES: uracil-DNA glycosylase [Bacillus]|uniref:uracil-DNA glycosylase n=1 Tax=Bacillus TaxID=1386 RepID=UPI000BB8D69B|nr:MULTISPECIES: uracil-DNA glycosylase [Bacillus]